MARVDARHDVSDGLACAHHTNVTRSEHDESVRKGRARTIEVSRLDTQRKFVLDIRFFSSIIYILYEGESLSPPVDSLLLGGAT